MTLSKEKLLAFGQHRGELGNSREVIRLLELASNEFCLANPDMFLCYRNGKVYLPDGKQFGFAREEYPIMPEGTVLLPGSAKSAAFIEGPKGRRNGNIALIVDGLFFFVFSPFDHVSLQLRRPVSISTSPF